MTDPGGSGGPALAYEGSVAAPDATGDSGSMSAGPGVRIALRIDDEMRVTEIAFETCALDAARVPASRMCGAILGGTIEQASAISVIDIGLMSGLVPGHPAVRTVHFAKSAALLPWLGRRARGGAHITCVCFQVETETIRRAIRERRLSTVDEIKYATKAGSGCGSCRPDLATLLAEEEARPTDAGT